MDVFELNRVYNTSKALLGLESWSTLRYQPVQSNAHTTTISRLDTRSVGIKHVNSGLNRDICRKI